MSRGRILLQMSGSIACFKACDLLSRLVNHDYEVEVVMTPSALEFVGEATIEGLTGKPVHKSVFDSGKYMDHIRLARWAELLLLCPATANTICKLAAGIGDDLISTLFLAHDFSKPYVIAPAMNATMMSHPAVQGAIEKLRAWKVEVLPTGEGRLACGETGEGRLLEPEQLFGIIESRLAKDEVSPRSGEAARRLDVLVTSGGTRESIDRVRSIANLSTGRTGAAIADYLSGRGHRVTLLRAADAMRGGPTVTDRTFVSFAEFQSLLESELSSKRYDAVIHAAAVSDFAVDEIMVEGRRFSAGTGAQRKIESSGPFSILLRPNPKLVDGLRALSMNPDIRIVAFKLTDGADDANRDSEVKQLAARARPDLIVHNDVAAISGNHHPATIYAVGEAGRVLSVVARASSGAEIGKKLEALL